MQFIEFTFIVYYLVLWVLGFLRYIIPGPMVQVHLSPPVTSWTISVPQYVHLLNCCMRSTEARHSNNLLYSQKSGVQIHKCMDAITFIGKLKPN